MLSSIIIGGDPDLVRYLRQVCAEFADIFIYKVLSPGVRRYQIVALLNSYAPDVAFLDVSDLRSADSLASLCLEDLLPARSGTVIVPFSKYSLPLTRENYPGVIIGPTLTPPFSAEHLSAVLRDALHRGRPSTRDSKVVAVLPAKPGSGSTTLAVHLAANAAATYEQKTLLVEADLHSGSLVYMLNLTPTRFVGDVMQSRLDTEAQWTRATCQSHGVDILPASAAPDGARGTRWDLFRLLKLAREQYDTIVVDLPSQVDDLTESIFVEADAGILVTTPSLPALNLARRRLFELERRDIRDRNLRLLVNRHSPGDPTPREMGAIIHHEVDALAPEDARALKSAARRQSIAEANSKFARALVPLTGELLGLPAQRASHSWLGALRNFLSPPAGNPAPGAASTSGSKTWGGKP